MKIISWQKTAEGYFRWLKARFQPSNIIVTEYPRSGGTWFANIISEYFGMPFPRNKWPHMRSCILHGHYLHFSTKNKMFVLFRDGRDIMVSFYFYSFFENEFYNHPLVAYMKKVLPFRDFNDVKTNLPEFIEYKFTQKYPPRFTWAEFVESWIDKAIASIRYEDLLQNTSREVGQSIDKIYDHMPNDNQIQQIVHKYSFKAQSKRYPGQEDSSSFLRKGISGDWKNYFNKEARELFDYYAGDQLIKLGYEKDRSWV